MYPVWPNSPPPADAAREPIWASDDTRYDNGGGQFSTTWYRPLYEYTLNYNNAQGVREQQIEDFWNQQRGHVYPFLWTDPMTKHHYVASAAVNNQLSRKDFRFYTATDSWRVIPSSGNFVLTSTLSGALTQNVHYVMSQDNGTISIVSASVNSLDSYRWSGTFFRKVHFKRNFRPSQKIWDNFGFNVEFSEVLP